MKNSKTILEIMMGDHALIEVLLLSLKSGLDKKDSGLIDEFFGKLRWELEKHIFVEEKVIFRLSASPESENYKIIQALVREHDIMLETLNEMQNDLLVRDKADILKLQNSLLGHQKVEEKTLYPKLDEELDKSQKEIIIARISEIPIKGGEELV